MSWDRSALCLVVLLAACAQVRAPDLPLVPQLPFRRGAIASNGVCLNLRVKRRESGSKVLAIELENTSNKEVTLVAPRDLFIKSTIPVHLFLRQFLNLRQSPEVYYPGPSTFSVVGTVYPPRPRFTLSPKSQFTYCFDPHRVD